MAPATRNQIQLAIKSFYRFFNGTDDFTIDAAEVAKAYDGHRIYKPFLEHISQRRTTRRKDHYLSGDTGRIQQKVLKKRLTPTEVLRLIEGCNLARDAFLIVLLYNTGLRIGEALGLHHIDIDLLERSSGSFHARTTPMPPARNPVGHAVCRYMTMCSTCTSVI